MKPLPVTDANKFLSLCKLLCFNNTKIYLNCQIKNTIFQKSGLGGRMYLIIFFLLIISCTSAQTKTFERIYEKFQNCEAIEKNITGGYYLAAVNNNSFRPVRLNSGGRLLWEGRTFQFFQNTRIYLATLELLQEQLYSIWYRNRQP
jgi:hypothetical protein